MNIANSTTFPSFLVIGAAKSGTYTLNEYFARHPQVFMCPNKEPHFFSFCGLSDDVQAGAGRPAHTWVNSLEEYRQLFATANDARMAGECSVSYLYWPGTAERIYQFNPDMRLIVSLREPVGRAYSSFHYAKGYGIEPLRTLADGFAAEYERIQQNQSILLRYRDLGLYCDQLKRFYNVFPAEQIKVILFEDLVSDPVTTVGQLYEFIGVAPDIGLDPDVHANATRVPDDSNPLHRFINGEHWFRSTARKILPMPIRQNLRHRARKAFSKRPPRMDGDERKRFLGLFADDIRQLEGLIGRDLSAWTK